MKEQQKIDREHKPSHGRPIILSLEEPEMLVLDNGLPTYLIKAGQEDVIRVDISIKAGAAFQHKKLLANSTGKLLIEGTASFSSSFIAEKLDFYGAYLEVNISPDNTILSLFSLTKHLNEMLGLVSEIIAAPVFPENELKIHLERKKHEFLVNSEKVKYVALNEFARMVFGKNSAYGQTLEEGDFDKIKREDLLQFFKQYYLPGNAYMVLSGKIDNEVINLVNKHIGKGWAKDKVFEENIQFTESITEKKKLIERPGSLQSAIRVGAPIINKMHPDYNRFILLNTIFGGYFGSRLMSNLREDKGYTYGVSSYVLNYINQSVFSVSTEINSSYTEQALQEILKEMEILRTVKVDEKELNLVKNYIYGTFLRNFDGPFALADRFKSVKDFGLGFDYYKKSLDEIMHIKADELLETAQKYLNPENMVQLVVGSFGS